MYFASMEAVTRILVIRFSSIGDIVLTTPIVRGLKTQLDGAVHIDFITKRRFSTLLEGNPHIDRVICIDKRVSEVSDILRQEHYDYVVDLHNNLRSKQVKRLTRSMDFTLDKRNLAKWLYVQTKREILSIGHVVHRGYQTVKALGVNDDGKGLDFFIDPSQEVAMHTLPEAVRNGYIAYAIGGQMPGKVLPIEQMVSLCQRIKQPMVLLGGPEDRATGDLVVSACGARVFNACGAFSLQQSASLLRQAQSVLTHDTGLMHIAAALGKKVVSLWFATTPQLGFAPYHPAHGSVMVEAHCPKRPTSKLGNRGYSNGCVFNLDLNAVLTALG
jgi:ADP-heptose:LPS heptosyltransferase